MLNEPGLIAEAVIAVFSNAMKVGLIVPISATQRVTILIEAEFLVAWWKDIVFGGCPRICF